MDPEIAERLAQMRRRRGLSQGELARTLGLSRQAVSKWERGESSPDTENIVALADLYGVSLDELVRPESARKKERDDGCESSSEPVADPSDPSVPVAAPIPDRVSASNSEVAAAAPHPRRWTRRAAIGLGATAIFGAGIALGAGVIPYPGGYLEPKALFKRMLGYSETISRDFNTAGFRNVSIEWPAGTVELVPTSAFFPLTVEEQVPPGGGMRCSYEVEDGTLRLWDGDARAWDDPTLGRDLKIWLPMDDAVDERGRSTGGWSFDTLALNTSTAAFEVARLSGRRLVATLRDGALTDVPSLREGVVFAEHSLQVEELELSVDAGTVHVRGGSRSCELRVNGGSAFVTLTDGAVHAGEDVRIEAFVESGVLAVCQPNLAEGCTARVELAGDDAQFASSLPGLAYDADAAAYVALGDREAQTDASPLVRTPDEIVYDVAMAAGTFGIFDARGWLSDVDEPDFQRQLLFFDMTNVMKSHFTRICNRRLRKMITRHAGATRRATVGWGSRRSGRHVPNIEEGIIHERRDCPAPRHDATRAGVQSGGVG